MSIQGMSVRGVVIRAVSILAVPLCAGCVPEVTHPDPLPNAAEVERLRGALPVAPAPAAPSEGEAPATESGAEEGA